MSAFQSPLAPPVTDPAPTSANSVLPSSVAERARRRWLTLVGLAVAGLGCLLPWVNVQALFVSVSVDGTHGDGPAMLLFLGAAVALVLATSRPWVRWVTLGLAAIPLLDAFSIVNKINDLHKIGVAASVGFGLVLVIAGSLTAVIASAIKR